MKKLFSMILVLAILLTSCSNTKKDEEYPVAIDDNYANYYEIYVGGYCDSDGDGVGDFKGLTQKLDYLNDGDPKTTTDLGVTGIWLMPINPSPSYHKYDVTDYLGIDSDYGTMEDFEQFLAKAKENGIKVIMDLVLNHTSSQHPWFLSAKESLSKDNSELAFDENSPQYNPCCDYYVIGKDSVNGKYEKLVDDWVYEAEFWEGMPDLNLDNEEVRQEIIDISKFWLDKGVDGFRLDAVIHYYNENTELNIQFMDWYMKELRKIKPDVYVVGEAWTSSGVINDLYKSEISSLFNFSFSGGTGIIIPSVLNSKGSTISKYLATWDEKIHETYPNAIDCLFLSNHDNARSAGALGTNLINEKMAAAVYILAPGNPFIYYGEEIGMKGSGKDENKRQPMVWSVNDSKGMATPVANSTNTYIPEQGVKEQLEDENSLLSFYKKVIRLKDLNPEIARGRIEDIDFGLEEICAYKCTYNDEVLYIIHNLGEDENIINLSDKISDDVIVRGSLTAGEGSVILKDGIITMPDHSSIVLKVKK